MKFFLPSAGNAVFFDFFLRVALYTYSKYLRLNFGYIMYLCSTDCSGDSFWDLTPTEK